MKTIPTVELWRIGDEVGLSTNTRASVIGSMWFEEGWDATEHFYLLDIARAYRKKWG